MNKLELIALQKLKEIVWKIEERIKENDDKPTREVQHVLPWMKTDVKEAINIINALENNNQ